MNKDNQIHFENEDEIRNALAGIKEEGKNMSSNGEWNEVKIKSGMLNKGGAAVRSNYKIISAAASLLLVAALSVPAIGLLRDGNETVKSTNKGNATSTTKPNFKTTKDESQKIDDGGLVPPDGSNTENQVPATTIPNSTPDETSPPVHPYVDVPTRLKLVSAVPVGPTANTQTYNVTFSWDAQQPGVRYCGEIDVMEFEDNDPLKASHGIYHSGSSFCDYDTEAIDGNTITYTLELTKGNEFRFYLSAVTLYDNKGPRATAFIVE